MRKILRNALALSALSALTTQAQVLVEYANRGDFPAAPYSNFFYTADPGEQAALDAGSFGAFYRTGATFNTGGTSPVCRFYGSVSPGPNSHFYTANAAECTALKAQQRTPRPTTTQQWNYEGDGFRVTPAAGSICPAGTKPVYRAYNDAFSTTLGKQAWDSNHRLSTRPADLEVLKRRGWRDEGVAFCVAATPVEAALPSADSLAGQCAVVRPDPSWGDKPGSLASEKKWVRSFADERYLWYYEIPRSPEAWYPSGAAYMEGQLSPFITPSNTPRDRYSFTMSTEDYLASDEGVALGVYGMEYALISRSPFAIGVTYTEPGSPAALAGIQRGDRVMSVDGISIASITDVNQLISLLYPTGLGQTHLFVMRGQSGAQRSVSLTSANITLSHVQNVKTLATASGSVGYLTFNAFDRPAEGQLIAAFNQLKAANVKDLVLDLRYNGGGLIYIASQLGYMIAGTKSLRKTFVKAQFNDKRVAENNDPDAITPFYSITSGFAGSGTSGNVALPTLNLSRVYVLGQYGTASASELVINGLRGIGVEVILVGDTTYGKPYGFTPEENCGTVYLLVEMAGVNALGFGDYGDGFNPTCRAPDDISHALGDAAESSLAAALTHRATGACPPGTAGIALKRNASNTPDLQSVRLGSRRTFGMRNETLRLR